MDDLKLDLIFSTVRTAMSVADVNKTVDQQKYATRHSERLRFWPKIKQLLSNCPASDLTFSSKTAYFH